MTLQGELTRWGPQREGDLSGHGKNAAEVYSPLETTQEGSLETREECDLARGAHKLGPASGGCIRMWQESEQGVRTS